MSAPLTLLFICECSDNCLRFQDCLEREGYQLLLATNPENAAQTLLSPYPVDTVLIHDSSSARGSVIASGLKLISPHIPMLLITGDWPSTGACPSGVDALCHTRSLSSRAARDIARFVRCFVGERSQYPAERPQYSHAQLVAKRPTSVN